jgi:hypothetical protein
MTVNVLIIFSLFQWQYLDIKRIFQTKDNTLSFKKYNDIEIDYKSYVKYYNLKESANKLKKYTAAI